MKLICSPVCGRNLPTLMRGCCTSSLPLPQHISPRPKVDYNDLPKTALKLYNVGIQQVSPQVMVRDSLLFDKTTKELKLYSSGFSLKRLPHSLYRVDKNVHVVAVGKAVTGLCRAVEDVFGDDIVQGLAVVPENAIQILRDDDKEHLIPSSRFEILAGGDGRTTCEQSLLSARRVFELVGKLDHGDILIALVSGGGSALLTMPKPPVTLEDKIELVQLMTSHGVPYLEQNIVCKNLSQIKGGGLSAMASPAKVVSLTLSNLPHHLFSEVGSGITTADSSTPRQALEIIRKYQLVDKVPMRVRELLQSEAEVTTSTKWLADSLDFKDRLYREPMPRHDVSNTVNILAGSDEIAVGAILRQCAEYEIPAHAVIQTHTLSGTHQKGSLFACLAQYTASILQRSSHSVDDKKLVQVELECIQHGMTKAELIQISKAANEAASMKKPICLIFTSEIAVQLKDGSGEGGPCQEVALATAIELKRRSDTHSCLQDCDVHLLSIDSDGMDGGTRVAGVIANCQQADQMVCGHPAQFYLDNNDSYTFYSNLERGKYHIVTGVTGTDIQNLQLLLIRSKSW